MKVSFYFKGKQGESAQCEVYEMQVVPREGELVDIRSKKRLYSVVGVSHIVEPYRNECHVALLLEFVGEQKEGS